MLTLYGPPAHLAGLLDVLEATRSSDHDLELVPCLYYSECDFFLPPSYFFDTALMERVEIKKYLVMV